MEDKEAFVGLFFGREAFVDAHGGFYYVAAGQRRHIRQEHVKQIMCPDGIEIANNTVHKNNVGVPSASSSSSASTPTSLSASIPDELPSAHQNDLAFIAQPQTSVLGVRFQIVQMGKGTFPLYLNQTVKIDYTVWYDYFEGNKMVHKKGWSVVVSDLYFPWEREAVLSMRVGEIRRMIVPPSVHRLGKTKRYVEIRLIHMEHTRTLNSRG